MGRALKDHLRALAESRVFFAHQSVGENILEGLRELAQSEAVSGLHIVSLEEGDPPSERFLLHVSVGQNMEPMSKIEGFEKLLRERVPKNVEIALLKFCYVDFWPDSDVDRIFEEYVGSIIRLQSEFPAILFLHTTVPLKARMLTFKDRIKQVLGKPLWEDQSNRSRFRFNQLLRARFPDDQILDIAGAESTRADGTRCEITLNGEAIPCMDSSYSNDGGHLNTTGMRHVATLFAEGLATNLTALGDRRSRL